MTVRRTSYETYYQIKREGLLSKTRWLVYDALFPAKEPVTGSELRQMMALRVANTNSNVITRLGELRDAGVVCEMPVRKCRVTGRSVVTWMTTDGMPKKRDKKEFSKLDASIATKNFLDWMKLKNPDLLKLYPKISELGELYRYCDRRARKKRKIDQ